MGIGTQYTINDDVVARFNNQYSELGTIMFISVTWESMYTRIQIDLAVIRWNLNIDYIAVDDLPMF